MRRVLNYFEEFLVFVSAVSGYVLIFTLAALVDVPVGIASSIVGLKICAFTPVIKTYKSIIKKKRKKKHDNMLSLAKTKLNTIKVLISKALVDSYINHDGRKKEIKNHKNAVEYTK